MMKRSERIIIDRAQDDYYIIRYIQSGVETCTVAHGDEKLWEKLKDIVLTDTATQLNNPVDRDTL
jgi:hypothetical protein